MTKRSRGKAAQAAPAVADQSPVVVEATLEESDISPDEAAQIEILPAEVSESPAVEIPVEVEDVASTEDRSGLSKYDALTAYLAEVKRHQPLSREEEHALAVRYASAKDRDAAIKLISANLWLVVKIARDYERAARSLLDVIQEGNIGLMEAIKNFDPYRGVRFPSYAVWWIKAYIIRYVLANWRMVKLGTTQAQRKLFFNLQKEKERLTAQGFFPAPKLLAEKLDVKESEVTEMEMRLSGSDVSVDAPLDDDADTSLLSVLASPLQGADTVLEEKERLTFIHDAIQEFLASANPKEQAIMRQRLLVEEKATLQELADQLQVSVERVRQIEERLKEKLKDFVKNKITREHKEDIEV